jgi:hypothetical protein
MEVEVAAPSPLARGQAVKARWSGWIWVDGSWKKVCEKGGSAGCARELARRAKAAGVKDRARLALSLGGVPPWTPQPIADPDKGPLAPD